VFSNQVLISTFVVNTPHGGNHTFKFFNYSSGEVLKEVRLPDYIFAPGAILPHYYDARNQIS